MKLIYSTYLDTRTNSSTNEFLIQWNFLVPFLQNNRIDFTPPNNYIFHARRIYFFDEATRPSN